ncbi:excalibur calcium-binding domain-containing protein [Kitasatospora sp. NPDC051170]|uniref:excalibur calcium-binding domain-containing protein n=1 Tax=Kitasatospora sp. NPDC051170 TaxID=3364056 RepID=UPI0037952602
MTSSLPSPVPPGARPWWRRPAVIVLALIFLPPVGLILLWTSPWKRPAKVAVSVVGGLYCLIWFAAVLADPKKPDTVAHPVAATTAAASSAPSEAPSPSPTTAPPSPTTTATPTPTPTPTPPPTQAPAPPVTTPPKADVYYANCDAAWKAGAAPLHRGDAGYRADLDSDGDGTACETRPGSGTSGSSTGGPASGSTGGSSGGSSSGGSGSTSGGGGAAYYANCKAAKAAGAAPLHRGDPGYRAALDGDGDGVACEH